MNPTLQQVASITEIQKCLPHYLKKGNVIFSVSYRKEIDQFHKHLLDSEPTLNSFCKSRNLQVDGGMTANDLLMQLQSDLSGITVSRPYMAESTALGAAMVAGAAVQCWDIETTTMNIPQKVWHSKMSGRERDERYGKWKMAVERAMGWDK